MVYLLKWLISLITPHTHDKEGKQGKSFIVRKALGNRASFSSLASKKGSSLLLVVMTMSVIIVISSSFMLLSFNTGIGSIFASSQQKAQLSCLSVAEGLKDGNTFDKIVSYYDTRLRDDSTNHEAEFVANNDNLNGETKVKLKAEFNGSAYSHIIVTVTTTVGKSKYSVTFKNTLTRNDVRDVISQVSNSMSVSGGGSFTMETGEVDGDLSLDGDYLLAMVAKKSSGKKWTIVPGTISGNVYCNGTLVLGFKNTKAQDGNLGAPIYRNDDDDPVCAEVVATRIKQNLYVNGDLVINACEIEGDVYVSGNVLLNGLADTKRGNLSGNDIEYKDNAVIKGNLYVGGSLYVSARDFERYYTWKEFIKNNKGETVHTGGYTVNYDSKQPKEGQKASWYGSNGFPKFPSASEIHTSSPVLSNEENWVVNYNKPSDDDTNYSFTFKNGNSVQLERDILDAVSLESGKTKNLGKIFNNDYSKAQIEWADGTTKKLVIYAKYVVRYIGWTFFEGAYSADNDNTAYNALFKYLTEVRWDYLSGILSQESSKKNDSGKNIRNDLVIPYENEVFNNHRLDSFGFCNGNSLVVQGNVYVQGNGFVEANNGKLGKKTYFCGSLEAYSYDDLKTTFANVWTGSKKDVKNVSFNIIEAIGEYENYYRANVSLCGDEKSSAIYGKSREYGSDKHYKFWDGSDNNEFTLSGNPTTYKDKDTSNKFTSENIGGNNNAKEGYTLVKGIMAGGIKTVYSDYSKQKPDNHRGTISFDNLKTESFVSTIKFQFTHDSGVKVEKTNSMYSEEFLKNHNGSNALRDEQRRITTVSSVVDVFLEMGVVGYSTVQINEGYHLKGYAIDRADYYYDNLRASGKTKYESGANKLNDFDGINFTGVTAAVQIKFGYTIQKALNAEASGVIVTKSRDDFYSKLIKLNKVTGKTYDDVLAAAHKQVADNYTTATSSADKAGFYFEAESDERPTDLAGDKTRKKYFFVYIVKDMVLSDAYMGFGDKKEDERNFRMFIDTSYRSVSVYWGSDYNGNINFGGYTNTAGVFESTYSYGSYVQTSMVMNPNNGKQNLNVGYIYVLPNIEFEVGGYSTLQNNNRALSNGYGDPNIIYSMDQRKEHIKYIMTATDTGKTDTQGQKIYYCSENNTYYKYSTKSSEGAIANESARPMQDVYYSNFVMMWDNSRVYSAKRTDNGITSISIPMFICEGPMLFVMYQNSLMNGMIYSPNPKSTFLCGSNSTLGTINTSDGSISGGAIVVGNVKGTSENTGTWQYFPENNYDFGKLLTDALLDPANGLGGLITENGTSSSSGWSAGEYT